MGKNKSSISQASSYLEIGEFWDSHDLGDFWDQTRPVEFDVDLQREVILLPLDRELSEKVAELARKKGVRIETLLTSWVQEKLSKESGTTSP